MRGFISTVAVVALLALPSRASATTITFEGLGFAEGDTVTTQYSVSNGVTFTNASVLVTDDSPAQNGFNACNELAGSLSSTEFPPKSNCNVITAPDGAMRIDFASAMASVGAYFTYTAPLTIEAFDASNTLLGTATSLFTENFVSSGNAPNEFVSLSFAGIRSLVLTSVGVDPATGEEFSAGYTLDDLTFSPADTQPPTETPVPEPGTIVLVGLAGVRLLAKKRVRK